ncbi:AAA family ATPase [Bacillus sp. FSL K6-3431]|uniref:AAA family ATPase n=1 Tax=Bacillus sp. FSL K6-3431 TaxID=2921500 RepID=UPI0030F7BCD9
MRIKKVKISNFKNYYGEIIFDLTKQITILHGNNGFGKSSFFDAIEWCLTNNIDRYNGTDAEIKKDIINRNCDLSNLTVSVEIEFGGIKLLRSFNVLNDEVKNTQVIITSEEGVVYRGQENVENYLKKENFKDVNFGKGIYGQLIKQTYILSQDQVTEFINSEDNGGRYRALANIMGLKSMLNETDNTKKILSALKTKEKEIEVELEKYKSTIKSKEEVKRVVDIYSLNSKLTRLGITISENNLDDECRKVEENLINERNQNEKFLRLYKEFELDNYTSIELMRKQVFHYEKNEKSHRNKIKKREDLLSEIQKQIKGLEKEKEDLQKYNQIRSDIRENEMKLDELDINEKNIEEINIKLESKRDDASKLEYQLSVRKLLTINNERIKELKSENVILQKKSEMLIRRRAKLTQIEQKLSLLVDSSKNKIMAQLISSIKDIKTHVKKSELKQCPVCSSIPEQDLEECIDKNIILLNAQVQEDTNYLEKSMHLLRGIERKVDKLVSEINKISSRIEGDQLTLNRLTEEVVNIKLNVSYESSLEAYSDENINDNLNETRKSIGLLQDSFNILFKLNKLYEQLNNKEEFGNRINLTEHRKESEIDIILVRFNSVKEGLAKRISNNQKKLEEIKMEMKNLESIVLRVVDCITLEEHNKKFIDIFLITTNNKIELNEKLSILSYVKEMSSDMKINKEIEQQISEVEKKKSIQVKTKNEMKLIIEVLDNHLQQKAEKFGNEAKDFLNKDNSSIQKFFRYLNPLPSNSILTFEGIDEDLNIKIDFDKEYSRNKLMSNAKNVLSSGQLNVLAISIFLAINEGQKTHPLDFVAIDDPIQNMDDVNQYSICDVLGSIDKQLIFSTHDLEFLKLFIKKNEHKKENIQVYSFMSPYLNIDKVNKIIFT